MNADNAPVKQFKKIFAIILILLFISIFIFVVFYQKTTTTTISEKPIEQSVITCSRNYQNDNDILFTNNPDNLKIQIRSVYRNDVLDEFSLNYYSEYKTKDLATEAESKLHAAYDIYLGNKNIDISIFSPSYNIIDNTVRIVLYTKAQDYNESLYQTSQIFYLPSNTDIASLSSTNLKKQYANAGFSCTEE